MPKLDTKLSFEDAARLIAGARQFSDVLAGSGLLAVGGPVVAYKKLVRIVHPDLAPGARTAAATDALARLTKLYDERARIKTYEIGALVAAGDIADLYAVDGDTALLKVPRQPEDNDLLAAEAEALTRLRRDGDPTFRPYAPRLIESFQHEDTATGARRTVNVVRRQGGFVSVADVARARPDGVDPRDAAWMWRRLLTGLGWAHRAGIVHGAVLPEHVLIHPAEHGLVLVDWCCSVPVGGRIPAVPTQHRGSYPPEVLRKAPATPATDIHLATGLMRRLIGARLPEPLRRFADGCCYAAPRMRPQDAWRLLAEFDELIDNLFGPRTFRPFTI